MLKIPIIGIIVYNSIIARFARTLSTTFSAGVPIVDALESVAGAAGNRLYADAIMKIRDEVMTGIQLQQAIKNRGMFPTLLQQMTAIGEESGALDEMLEKAATHYEEAVDNSVDNLTSLLEPLIMSVLGVLVGGLLIAMYLPIFQLGNVV
jgi:type IV pilus assembly protein PilC